MRNDPIVEEVRKAREEILAECGGDLDKLTQRIRGEREDYLPRLVTLQELRQRKADAAKRVVPDDSK